MTTKENTNALLELQPSPSKFICIKPMPKHPPLPAMDSGSALIKDANITTPDEIVAGILHKGTKGVIASGSKAGKTWLLLHLAISVATGTDFLGWKTRQGKVLFINFEIHKAFIRERLQAVHQKTADGNLDDLNVWNLRGQSMDFETIIEKIINTAKKGEYSLIVIDPIYKAMTGKNENTAKGVGVLCGQIERLVECTGAAVVFSHHFTKGNQSKKTAMDRMSGSGVFARDADTIICLTEHASEGCYSVELNLRNFPPQPSIVVEWNYPIMEVQAGLDPADLKIAGAVADQPDPLLDLLAGTTLKTGEWQLLAAKAGYSRATFFRMKGRLENDGLLRFDNTEKTWARADEVKKSHENKDETSETNETAPHFVANAQTVIGIKTSTDLLADNNDVQKSTSAPDAGCAI